MPLTDHLCFENSQHTSTSMSFPSLYYPIAGSYSFSCSTPKLIFWYLQQLIELCIHLYSISCTLVSVRVILYICNFVSNIRNMGRHQIWRDLPINHFLMLKMWSRQVNQYSRSVDTWIAQCTWCKTTLSKSTLQSSNKQTLKQLA